MALSANLKHRLLLFLGSTFQTELTDAIDAGGGGGGGSGDITSVTAGTGLTGGGVTGAVTLNVNVGTTSNKIVQLDSSARLPAVDGSQLINLPSGGGGSGDITSVTAGTGLTGGGITGAVTLNVDVGTTASKIVQLTGAAKLPAVDASLLTNIDFSPPSDGGGDLGTTAKRFAEVHVMQAVAPDATVQIDFDNRQLKNEDDEIALDWSDTNIDINGRNIINSAEPTVSHHLATKGYVDSVVVSGGANTDLGNLDVETAVNASLVPDTDGTLDLGSEDFSWLNVWASNLQSAAMEDLNIGSGAVAVDEDSGDVIISPATVSGTGTRGKIVLADGSEGVTDELWASTGVDGAGAWSDLASLGIVETSDLGVAGGVATLDGGGKVPIAQLPNSIMQYVSVWNASTNTPTLADGVGNANEDIGNVYRVSVAGTIDLGSGSISYDVGDYVILNASKVFEKSDTTDAVASVNGSVGIVTVNAINELTGDVTASAASGSQSKAATIANLAVTNAKIANSTIDLTAKVTGTLPSANGGTSQSTYTTGDIIYASATNTLSKLAIGSSNQILTVIAGIPSWQTVSGTANTALSNLAATAVNVSIVPNTDNSINLGSTAKGFITTYTRNVVNPTFSSNLALSTTTTTGSVDSGQINLTTGDVAVSQTGGSINLLTGKASSGNGSGAITITTGQAASARANISLEALNIVIRGFGNAYPGRLQFNDRSNTNTVTLKPPDGLNSTGINAALYIPQILSPATGAEVLLNANTDRFFLNPQQYNTGTVSQSGTTVTGSGTAFTSAMIGSYLTYLNGVYGGVITAVGGGTSMTVNTSQTVTSQAFSINYPGMYANSMPLLRPNGISIVVPTGVSSTSGGTLAAGNNYARIVAVDASGLTMTLPESAAVATTGATSSITWSWTAMYGAVSYQIWVATSSGAEASFFTSTANTFVQTTTTGSAGTMPTVNNLTNFVSSRGMHAINLLAKGTTTTATAAGTTTLTNVSTTNQQFTGTTTQTVVLPSALTLPVGAQFSVMNRSTGAITINMNGGSLLATAPSSTEYKLTLVSNATAAGTWDALGIGVATFLNNHIKSTQTTAPVATVDANAGTGATASVANATDTAGIINLTSTAVAPSAGSQVSVAFNSAYTTAPIVTITPRNADTANFAVASGVYVTTTASAMVINFANQDAVGHAYSWFYHVIETQ